MSASFEAYLESRPIRAYLYDSEYGRVGLIPGTDIVFFRQTAVAVPMPKLEETWLEIEGSFSAVARPSHSFMLDVRKARGRNDAEFERRFAPLRVRMGAGWRKMAIVVMTAPGVLQVQRYIREDKLAMRVFDDPDVAFNWLREK